MKPPPIPTDEQKTAIRSEAGITLVIAGPGTGKTFTLARRVRRIWKRGTPPDRIMVFTFSNRAAAAMETELSKLCPGLELPWLGTSHAICGRILDAEGIRFAICDEYRQRSIVTAIIEETALDIDADDAIAYIQQVKIPPTASAATTWDANQIPLLRKVYDLYQARLRESGLKDFNDLLKDTVDLFERKPSIQRRYQKKFRHIVADEVQDFNPLQFKLMTMLKGKNNVLWCVGDDDQVIYSWLGADPALMQALSKRPRAKMVKLTHNFRSTSTIVEAAGALIAGNSSRIPKKNIATRCIGSNIRIRPAESANDLANWVANSIDAALRQGYAPSDIAVLGRRRICWQNVQRVLEKQGIPLAVDMDDSTYDAREAQALINYFKAIADPKDDAALEAIINYPLRGIGEKKLSRIKCVAKKHRCSYDKAIIIMIQEDEVEDAIFRFFLLYAGLSTLRNEPPSVLADAIIEQAELNARALKPLRDRIARYSSVKEFLVTFKPYSHHYAVVPKPGVRLLTIHGAKGLEFKIVILVGWEHGVLPDKRAFNNPAMLEEERRLAYVAMTRARDRLYIHYIKDSSYITGLREPRPSQFITEIPEEHICLLPKDERLSVPIDKKHERSINDYLCGDRVFHKKYGYGEIITVVSPHAVVKFNNSEKRALLHNLIKTHRE